VRTIAVALLAAIVVMTAACSDEGGQDGEVASDDRPGLGLVPTDQPRAGADATVSRAAVEGLNEFGYRYYALLAEDDDRDIVFSPVSIASVMAMLHTGARGDTATQLADVFGFPAALTPRTYNTITQFLGDLERATVRSANRLFPREGYAVEQAYVDDLAAYFGARVERVDFGDAEAAADQVNAWVSDRTRGLIPRLVSPDAIDEDTELLIGNALYLGAPWARPFDELNTRDEPFTLLDGETVDVPTMHAPRFHTRFAEGDGWQAVTLAYEEPALSMSVILPAEGRFGEIQDRFDAELVAAVDAAFTEGFVELSFPRWRSSASDTQLLDHIGELGFDADGGTDFTGIGADNPRLSAAVHAATIDVDEHGTIAAAATAGLSAQGLPPPADATITIDRPFLYLIRHDLTGTILFAGRVLDPR
jgi:serpin B